MDDSIKVTYDLPILDICAVFIAILAVFISIISIYLSNETRRNTEDTALDVHDSKHELIKIRILLEDIHKVGGNRNDISKNMNSNKDN